MSAVVIDSGIDTGAVLHYGDPLREARNLNDGQALTHLASTAVFTVTGSTRLQWLHLFLSQACDNAVVGESIDALILTPNGHIEFGLHVVDDGSTAWVLSDRSTKEALLAYMRMMVFTYDVTITDVSDDYAVVGGIGAPVFSMPSAHAPEQDVSGQGVSEGVNALVDAAALWRAGASFSTADPALDKYVPSRPGKWPAYEAVVPRGDVDALLHRFGAAGMWAWESLRAAAGVPRVVVDADHRSLPHELGLIGEAVHLRKGCYRGQEAVARTYNLGKPPRRFVLLHLDGSSEDLPKLGAEVTNGDEDSVVGAITTVLWHYELGPIALALVKRSLPLDATLSIDSGRFAASQQPIVVVPDEVSPVEQFRREKRANVAPLKDERTGAATPPST